MPRLHALPAALSRSGRRRGTARVRRALSPRGALALQSVDGALSFALRAALAMALPALPMALAGHADLAVYAMLGSFTTTFGRNLPYARRARVLALVAVTMTACVAGGSALAAWADPRSGGAGAAVVVAAMAAVAGAAKFACDAARLSGLGAVLLLFSFAVAANGSPGAGDILPRTALAASGAAVAWVLAVSGRLVHPDRPQRLAAAAALRTVADLREAGAGDARGHRHRATAAVLQAYRTLGAMPPDAAGRTVRGDSLIRLTDLSWALLNDSADGAPDLVPLLRRQARVLAGRRRDPQPLPGLAALMPAGGAGPVREVPATGHAAGLRATELTTGARPGGHGRTAVLLVPALRMTLGTGLAGGAALALGLGHGYWAAISAAAVLHSVNVRTAAQRAVQRTLGTVAGLLLALGVLATGPGPVVLVLVIVLLEFLLEYVVARNYGFGVVFLTPLALLLTDLAAPSPAGTLVQDRALGSVVGVVIALGCALVVVHDHAAVRVQRALAACTQASDGAAYAMGAGAEASFPVLQAHLAAAVVELREADDAAAGEIWSAEIDPTELAAAEQRAHLLLGRLARWR
ncbi:FUSC family protein [Streptomyces sp. ITFR-16]|uniref:FUSC family protein n=1 Tax=Streptomyces sp. ITFR-16 TaxID=3075198 RepID=UPI002889D9DB|nr:FUSC family protein [Streptomyces sp. ITFR-16]WNI26361.1 FUSC family protein [Streptomyces sp. ITFR-16]